MVAGLRLQGSGNRVSHMVLRTIELMSGADGSVIEGNFVGVSPDGLTARGGNLLVKSSGNLAVLLTGDFNSDAYDEDDLDNLTTFLGSPRDLHGEYNTSEEEYTMMFKWFNLYKRFDYIFAYDTVMQMPLRKIWTHSINVTDIKNRAHDSVSDHLAVKASLIFRRPSDVAFEDLTVTERDGK